MHMGTQNRRETHRKQQVADRKEQAPVSSSSLCLPLTFPINRPLQEVNWQSKHDVCKVPAQHHEMENVKVSLELRDNNLITGSFSYGVVHLHISFI